MFDKAVDAFDKIDASSRREYFVPFGTALNGAAMANHETGNIVRATHLFQRAIVVAEAVYQSRQDSQSRRVLAKVLLNAANLNNDQSTPRLNRLIQLLESAPEIERPLNLLGKAYHNRAQTHQEKGDREADAKKAIQVYEKYLNQKKPDAPSVQDFINLAEMYDYAAISVKGNPNEERRFGSKAIQMIERQLPLDPNNIQLKQKLAERYFNFGTSLWPWDDGDAKESLEYYDKSIPLLEKIRVRYPEIVGKPVYYLAYFHRAEAHMTLLDFAKGEDDYNVLLDLVKNPIADPGVKQLGQTFWIRWLRCVADSDIRRAISEIEARGDLINSPDDNKRDVLASVASIYALASESTEDQEEKTEFGKAAVAHLEALIDQGLIMEMQKRDIRQSKEFDSIRELPEFKELMKLLDN